MTMPLLQHAGPALAPMAFQKRLQGRIEAELAELLACRNGFYAYHKALLVRPNVNVGTVMSVHTWNLSSLWKCSYSRVARLDDVLFFAEDVFGVQFGIRDDAVWTFDPETGQLDRLCDSLSAWQEWVMGKPNVNLGVPIARDWQEKHGELPDGRRLIPKQPFVCHGEFSLENLICRPDLDGMLIRAGIAEAIRNVPDGTQIRFGIGEGPPSRE